ncbi:MAG: ABC transporter permease [Planctomycetaceae bacterium]|nr:ABC transporter permease [Planctomycetaceae bacterium]
MSRTESAPAEANIKEQSQWSLIMREFRKRKLAVLSGWVIILLIAVSVFAPFIANNRPIWYYGINRYEIDESIRTITTLALKISRLPDEPTAEELANARREARVIGETGRFIASRLPTEQRRSFSERASQIADLSQLAVTDASVRSDLKSMRSEFRSEYRDVSDHLTSRTYWPVFQSLSWSDIGFMVFIPIVVFAPIWMPFVNRCDPSGKKKLIPLVYIIIPVVSALCWKLMVPERVDITPYRAGLYANSTNAEDADVIYESVVWPLVPFALDESNLDLLFAEPQKMAGFTSSILTPEELQQLKEEAVQREQKLLLEEIQGSQQSDKDAPNKNEDDVRHNVLPWSRPHIMGTDDSGRDLFTRMIWGGRVSLAVGIVSVSIALTIGIIVGSIAGYFRGTADILISRVIEIVICFPSFFLILAIVAFLGPGIFKIMIVIGLTSWTGIARLVRGEFLRLSNQEFVLAGRALGYSPWRIIFKHILPNAMAPVLVSATFGVAGAILTESALSFLGLGISVPTPSWGGILATGRDYLDSAPWIIFYPGMAIFLTITSYNLVAEAFRDAADPRLRGKH